MTRVEVIELELRKLGCTDGGCVISRPSGMVTNGGCHCVSEAQHDTTQRMRVQRALTLRQEQARLLMVVDGTLWEDRETPDDEAIAAEHPVMSGKDARYLQALKYVEARHSKYALVDLVNWLLSRIPEKP